MSTVNKKLNFLESDEGLEARLALLDMMGDKAYMTEPTYSANTERYPNHQISFVDKHMEYLRTHPSTNPSHYLSNLRLMHRLR